MKLCIVKSDGSSTEILMNERQPSLDNLNSELLLFENYPYKLIIHDDELIENVELFVGDYSVPLSFNMITNCFETDKEWVFDGCFDLVYISVYIEDGEGKERIFYTDFLRIATTKQTAKQVEQMLEEIESNIPNFLEICFSKSKKKSGLVKKNIKSIWNTLKIVDEIIDIYEENYGVFSNHKKASVESFSAIVDTKAMRMIDQESLRWIVCNPDNLIPINQKSGIEINGKNFIPSKIKTYISKYSYDIYENRVILGFLKNVIDYIDEQIIGFNKEIGELANIPENIIKQLPNTHELTGRCVYVYYKGVIERFSNRRFLLQEIYDKYNRILECTVETLYGVPKLTNTFKQVYHYRLCYECMIKWFESGDYSFEHLNYLFKLKTLSRIFEYFCLIKIQTAIVQSGYVIKDTNRIIYSLEDDIEEINNQYVFCGQGYELTLLYEPTIWVNKINHNMNLYSTGYNFLKCKWNDKWTPDFILKISSDYRDYYYILDAKYSNVQNVKKRYIQELVLKYSNQIASKDKFFSDVIGVGAIYPGNEDKMYYFKKNAVNSQKPSLPQYFSLAIVSGNSGIISLKERIIELIKVVDMIEEERHVINDRNNEKIRMPFIDDKSDQIIMSPNKEKEENFDVEDGFSSNDYTNKKIVVRVNGKKCFYYAKGMCLNQKKICTIVDSECQYYLSKNDKKLLKTEDTCRNFKQYIKRRKVNRAECIISGFQGCIGQGDCKFYLKKNKR